MRISAKPLIRHDDPFYDEEVVVSSTECTGLMPSLPENHDEDKREAELYAIHDAKTRT